MDKSDGRLARGLRGRLGDDPGGLDELICRYETLYRICWDVRTILLESEAATAGEPAPFTSIRREEISDVIRRMDFALAWGEKYSRQDTASIGSEARS